MENNTPEEIWNEIKCSKNILMTLHAMPDGDSLGSCTAFKRVIEQNTKATVTLVSQDPISESMSLMPLTKEVQFGKDIADLNLNAFDLFLVLDTSEVSRLGKNKPEFKIPENLKTINIDHHHTNPYFGQINYIRSELPSCCSVIFSIFRDLKIKIDKETATRLLLGICTDTGFFTYQNSEKAIEEASLLIGLGAEYVKDIASPILYNQPLRLKKYFGLLFTKLRINKEKNFAYSILSQEEIKPFNLNMAEIRLGINEMSLIGGFDFVFNLIEIEDGIKGSFRSTKGINTSIFSKALGGGGHKAASAFILPKMPLEKAEKLVLETIKKSKIIKY